MTHSFPTRRSSDLLDDRNKWHAKNGPQNGIRLFRLVHDHFTAKGLDNLLWAFHTTQNAGALQEYYPGDSYVDIIGKSAYGRGRSEEHTSELQSLMRNSYAVFCLKKKKNKNN